MSIASKLMKARPWDVENRLTKSDQILRFLLRHQDGRANMEDYVYQRGERSIPVHEAERYWAQLAYQEPDDSYLSRSMRNMSDWIWKGRLIHQRTDKQGYHCRVAMLEGTSADMGAGTVLCISPDGKLLAKSGGAVMQGESRTFFISVCEFNSGCLVRSMAIHTGKICCVAWSPDNTLLASGGEDCLVHVTNGSGSIVCTLEGHAGNVVSVAWMPDSSLIITGSHDASVRLWGLEGELKFVLQEHAAGVCCVAASPDGRMFASADAGSTGGNSNVVVWIMGKQPKKKQTFKTQDTLTCLAWSRDGSKLATGAQEGHVAIWGRSATPLSVWGAHDRNNPHCVCPTSSVAFYAVRCPSCPVSSDQVGSVASLAFSPDGATLVVCRGRSESGSSSSGMKLWDLKKKQVKGYVPESGKARGSRYLSFLPDGRIVTGQGDDAHVMVWDIQDHASPQSTPCIFSVDVSPDGKLVATAGHALTHSSLACYPFCEVGGADSHFAILLWDTDTCQVVKCLLGHEGSVHRAMFNHDGSMIASCSADETMCMWSNIKSDSVACTVRTLQSADPCILWSPDGELLACADEVMIGILIMDKTAETKQILYIRGEQTFCYVWGMAWLSNSTSRLLVGTNDPEVSIWDVVSRTCLLEFSFYCSPLCTKMSFSDRNMLAFFGRIERNGRRDHDGYRAEARSYIGVFDMNKVEHAFGSGSSSFWDDFDSLKIDCDSEIYSWAKTKRSLASAQCADQSKAEAKGAANSDYMVMCDQGGSISVRGFIHGYEGEPVQVASFRAPSRVDHVCCVGSLIVAACEGQVCACMYAVHASRNGPFA